LLANDTKTDIEHKEDQFDDEDGCISTASSLLCTRTPLTASRCRVIALLNVRNGDEITSVKQYVDQRMPGG
jgi:hypothetical protein